MWWAEGGDGRETEEWKKADETPPWEEGWAGSERSPAAAQADPGAGTQALATGRPLEERDRLACDWLSLKPAIGKRAVSLLTYGVGGLTWNLRDPGLSEALILQRRGSLSPAVRLSRTPGPHDMTRGRVEPCSSPRRTRPYACWHTHIAQSFT